MRTREISGGSQICSVAMRAYKLKIDLHLVARRKIRGTVVSETDESFEGRFGPKQTNNRKIKAAQPPHSFTLLMQRRYLKYSPDFGRSLRSFINSTM